MKKASKKFKTEEILAVGLLFVIFTCGTTLHTRCMKNALVFSSSDTYNFFMQIIVFQTHFQMYQCMYSYLCKFNIQFPKQRVINL